MLFCSEQRKLTEEQFNKIIAGKGLSWLEEQALRSTVGLSYNKDVVDLEIESSSHSILIAWQKIRGNSLLARH